ncbi:uncharacterized protein LOC110835154 [Zootermopsis nevadensis]|uniref:uncharacterized protein LOC110835154 n=1 Tax=Zootermopsis nevadensis TaxID=136037 RepID=UPI000B8E5AC9|nr:uncharacterized protein LOC110835154 [Zootermopsis nevadensis]
MKIVILTAVLVLLSEAGLTNTGMSVPQWYTPCSNKERHSQSHRLRAVSNKNVIGRKLIKSLTKMTQQLNKTMELFKNQLLDDSYEEIQRAVDELQYVPKWVPGMGNVLMLFGERSIHLEVSRYLPKLHVELQKFSVAFEAVTNTERQRDIVEDTNTLLIQFLCEVEQALVMHQIGVPAPREERSLMADDERIPPDVTRHLIRDWGILVKYRDYLRYWRKLLTKMEKQRRKELKVWKEVKNQIPNTHARKVRPSSAEFQ